MTVFKGKTIKDILYIYQDVHRDDRGYFFESFNEKEFKELTGVDFHPVQDNESFSKRGVLRGIHFQKEPFAQAKLVRAVKGCVLDVAVDLRKDSPTFGKFETCFLDAGLHNQFFIPKGFGHGFLALANENVFQYKCNEYYHPEAEDGIAYDSFGLDWRKYLDVDFILSDKDLNRKTLEDYELNVSGDMF